MTMTAVKLSPENFSLITSKPGLPWKSVQRMYEDSVFLNETRFVVPLSTDDQGNLISGSISEDVLRDYYDFDQELINTQFVEITRK